MNKSKELHLVVSVNMLACVTLGMAAGEINAESLHRAVIAQVEAQLAGGHTIADFLTSFEVENVCDEDDDDLGNIPPFIALAVEQGNDLI